MFTRQNKGVVVVAFVVGVFGLTVLYPTGSEISRFGHVKTRGRKFAIEHILLFLLVHCGDFIEQIKKVCHIHYKMVLKCLKCLSSD